MVAKCPGISRTALLTLGLVLAAPSAWLLADDPPSGSGQDAPDKALSNPRSVSSRSSTRGKSLHGKVTHQNLELQPQDDVKVRRLVAPVVYDERGKPRKLTAAEISDLKGKERNQPGYAANLGDLKPGQVVKLSLVKQKEDPPASNGDGTKKPDKPAKETWIPAEELTGTLSRIDSATGALTLRVDGLVPRGLVLNPSGKGKKAKAINDRRISQILIVSDPPPGS
jgi:hypothetical protein